jgi:hypothetical protein
MRWLYFITTMKLNDTSTKLQRPFWAEFPYICYLEIVDYTMEIIANRTSTEEEMGLIASLQEYDVDPRDAALALITAGTTCCDILAMQEEQNRIDSECKD